MVSNNIMRTCPFHWTHCSWKGRSSDVSDHIKVHSALTLRVFIAKTDNSLFLLPHYSNSTSIDFCNNNAGKEILILGENTESLNVSPPDQMRPEHVQKLKLQFSGRKSTRSCPNEGAKESRSPGG